MESDRSDSMHSRTSSCSDKDCHDYEQNTKSKQDTPGTYRVGKKTGHEEEIESAKDDFDNYKASDQNSEEREECKDDFGVPKRMVEDFNYTRKMMFLPSLTDFHRPPLRYSEEVDDLRSDDDCVTNRTSDPNDGFAMRRAVANSYDELYYDNVNRSVEILYPIYLLVSVSRLSRSI